MDRSYEYEETGDYNMYHYYHSDSYGCGLLITLLAIVLFAVGILVAASEKQSTNPYQEQLAAARIAEAEAAKAEVEAEASVLKTAMYLSQIPWIIGSLLLVAGVAAGLYFYGQGQKQQNAQQQQLLALQAQQQQVYLANLAHQNGLNIISTSADGNPIIEHEGRLIEVRPKQLTQGDSNV